MPSIASILAIFTEQNMLYWQKTGSDSHGNPKYADARNPVLVAVRWEDMQREVLLATGRSQLSKAYILCASNLVVGSLVFLGGGVTPLADWQALPGYPAPPTVTQGGREVIRCKQTPGPPGVPGIVYEAYV
jgi:hypothetical protein